MLIKRAKLTMAGTDVWCLFKGEGQALIGHVFLLTCLNPDVNGSFEFRRLVTLHGPAEASSQGDKKSKCRSKLA